MNLDTSISPLDKKTVGHKEPASKEDLKLQEACQDFEGMLVGMVLKDSFKTKWAEDDESQGNEIMREFALEQTANSMGKQKAFGIADILFENVTRGRKNANEPEQSADK